VPRTRRHGGSAIHAGLVGKRALIGTRYLADVELRRQYERDIAPRTLAALGKVLAELFPAGGAAPRRVLDLGAGTGAAGAALRAAFGAELDVVAVDRVAAPGVVVADLAAGLPPVSGRFDLIVAAHLLGELHVGRPAGERAVARAARVRAWTGGLLATGGTIVIIEPALRETSRELLAVRDLLLSQPAQPALDVVAPCFWTGACPALERERDWCHDAAPVPSSPRVDFSYLVLRERVGATAAADPTLVRIVSDPLPEKGKLKLYGCGATGRHLLVRLDRDRAEANAAFGQLRRGDIARIGDTGDGGRVTAATSVARRR
jgi:SAM-dependent methyltransferase